MSHITLNKNDKFNDNDKNESLEKRTRTYLFCELFTIAEAIFWSIKKRNDNEKPKSKQTK